MLTILNVFIFYVEWIGVKKSSAVGNVVIRLRADSLPENRARMNILLLYPVLCESEQSMHPVHGVLGMKRVSE